VSEPTPGEITRWLENLQRQITDVLAKVVEDRRHADDVYMRRDVYNSDQRGDALGLAEVQRDVDDLKRHRETDALWRRQIMLAVAVLAITSLVTVAIAVSNYLAR